MRALLFLRYCLLKNLLSHLRREDGARIAVIGTAFATVMAGGMVLTIAGFRFVLRLPAMGEVISSGLVQLLFFVLLHFLIASNLLLGYSYLFRARRTSLYIALPIPPERVFLVRAGEAVLQSSWAGFVLVGAVLTCYGISHRAAPSFYALIPVVLLPFLALCGAAGVTLAFILAALRSRFGRRVFFAAALLTAVLGAAYLAEQVRALSLQPGREMVFFTRLTDRLRAMSSPFWPGKWASAAVTAFARGRPAEGFFSSALLAATACAFWPLLDLFGRRRYLRLWQDLSACGAHGARRPPRMTASGPRAAIIRKDLVLFFRDPTQFLQLALFVLLMGLYTISLLRVPIDILPQAFFRYVSMANLTAIAFILASFSARFVYPLLDTEGRAVWVLAAAPLRFERVVTAKLIMGCALLTPFALALGTASQTLLGVAYGPLLLGTLLVTLLALALASLALAFSASCARFKSDRPSEVLGTAGGTANFLASTGLVCVVMGLWVLGEILGRTRAWGLAVTCGTLAALPAVFAACTVWARRALRGREF